MEKESWRKREKKKKREKKRDRLEKNRRRIEKGGVPAQPECEKEKEESYPFTQM
jgi:hypothetical protein